MSSKSKMDKKSKAIFTINTDRLCEDSSEECFGKDLNKDDRINMEGFSFPLDYEIEEIHQLPQTTELSAYIKQLQHQVKSISNKIEFQYHQARQTVLFIGQSTNLSKFVSRKKIDEEFQKMQIIRKYDPKIRQKNRAGIQEEDLAKDAGDIALAEIKKKIQLEWESQISEQMEKQRRRLREIQKKRQKEIEQIDKDFEKIMKKRKLNKEAQAQLKGQQSMKSMQNGDSSSNRTPKKIQKREKIQRRASQRNREKSMNEPGVGESQIESCSVMNQEEQISVNENGQMLEFEQNIKMDLLEASNSNQWNHQIHEKPEHVMDSNQLNHDHQGINQL